MTKQISRKQLPNLWPVLFFPLTIVYEELLLRFGAVDGMGFDYHFLYPVVFAIAFGALLYALIGLIRPRSGRTAAMGILTFLLIVVICAEYCVKSYFQIFYEVTYMLTMSGDVTGDFSAEIRQTIFSAIPFIVAALNPLLLLVLFRDKLVPEAPASRKGKAAALAVFLGLDVLLCCATVLGVGTLENDREYFTSEYSINSSIPLFGMLGSMQLEFTYKLFGVPEASLFGGDPEVVEVTPEPDPEYDYNVLDIPFAQLAEETKKDTLKSLHSYFAAKAPTQQNEYTGMFEGKNLIFIVAEAFSPYVIDAERTPTLYKLSTEGFIFNDYYQPDWHQSTTGGEFSATTGLVPTTVDGQLSFLASSTKSMPFALGNQFMKLGYATRAYHNNTYTFYDRHLTHPNLGYDYKGVYSGLTLLSKGGFPHSDQEMFQVTMDEYIDNYVNNGEKFHTYYMTVSGHAGYYQEVNRMTRKNWDVVKDLDYSDEVLGYLACQMEVEYALADLMAKLEEAGIADDTVICLTTDHYPYKLSDNLYNELETVKTEANTMARYKNTLLLWCGSMEEPVEINVPCSSIDVVPTLSNLFGLSYDSRLLSGRDILATNYDITDPSSNQPFVIGVDGGKGSSWISLAGSYDSQTGEFTPALGYEAFADNEEYIKAMSKKAKEIFKVSRNLISTDYYAVVGEYITPTAAEPEATAEPAE